MSSNKFNFERTARRMCEGCGFVHRGACSTTGCSSISSSSAVITTTVTSSNTSNSTATTTSPLATTVTLQAAAANSNVTSVIRPASSQDGPSPAPLLFRHETRIKDGWIKIKLAADDLVIVPFADGTVGEFEELMKEDYDVKCAVVDEERCKYNHRIRLSSLTPPFSICIGEVGHVRNVITESSRADKRTVDKVDAGDVGDEEDSHHFKYRRIANAVGFMNCIHSMTNGGEMSINKCLIKLRKDRKTVDRFKNIYYMSKADSGMLDEHHGMEKVALRISMNNAKDR